MTLYACAVALPAPQQVLRVSLTCTLLKFNLSISQCKTFAEMTLCVKRFLKQIVLEFIMSNLQHQGISSPVTLGR